MKSTTRILVFGYINTNVMDGSAIFMSSLCKVLSIDKSNGIDLLLSVPYKRDVVLGNLRNEDNINIIDPYNMFDFSSYDFFGNQSMTHQEAAQLISEMDKKNVYDYIFIRSLDISNALLKVNTDIMSKTFNYVTGITSKNEELTEQQKLLLNAIYEKGGRLLCQTEQMKNHILKSIYIPESKIINLNPMIPDVNKSFDEIFIRKNEYNRFIYSGKFAHEWNTVPMIVQYREIIDYYSLAHLDIVGDQFKRSLINTEFVENASYLIESTANLTWHGAVSRNESMSLIEKNDVGITWRNKELNESLELSTKLLEYSSLGKPAIMNPTQMHKEIFGENYPFYAETDEDFYNIMKLVIENPELVEEWSEKVFEISRKFSFTSTYLTLAPHLTEDEEMIKYFEIAARQLKENEIYKNRDFLAFKLHPIMIQNLLNEKESISKLEKYKIFNDIIVLKLNNYKENRYEEKDLFRLMGILLNKYYKNNYNKSSISKKTIKVDNNKTVDNELTHKNNIINTLTQKQKQLTKQLALTNKRLEHQKDYSNRLFEQKERYKNRMLLLEERTKQMNGKLKRRK